MLKRTWWIYLAPWGQNNNLKTQHNYHLKVQYNIKVDVHIKAPSSTKVDV